MAISALGDTVLGGKLSAVRICVAAFAILGSTLKLNFMGTGKCLVAFVASDRAMCPEQSEFRF